MSVCVCGCECVCVCVSQSEWLKIVDNKTVIYRIYKYTFL